MSATPAGRPGLVALFPLFTVSLVAIGFEISLTRYFAIANWSEYGYWVISITMVGFAASGVVLSLFKDVFMRREALLIHATPVLLMVSGAIGFHFVTLNPFNPLELQNALLWADQVLNIGKYYLALFPFFFLTGLYVGLYFLAYQAHTPQVYAADLAGAGVGGLLILALMVWLHPFYLLAALLPPLALVSLVYGPPGRGAWRWGLGAGVLAVLAACEVLVIGFNQADFNKYKGIYPVLNVARNRVVEEVRSPRGYFLVLDNFTERLDTDFSNNAGLLRVAGPPETYGLYRDGNRVTSLPKAAGYDHRYVTATLDAGPFELLHAPRTLLIGTRGGFAIQEKLDLGASAVVALEPDPALYRLLREGVQGGQVPALAEPRVQLLERSPAEITAGAYGRFDLIEISSDFLDQSFSNKYAFTLEQVARYQELLTQQGILSIPVSIREFTLYAVKMLDTVREALKRKGIARPESHLIVYRSAWNVRILVGRAPFGAEQIRRLRAFSDRRSFDLSFYAGIDPRKADIWNDLPMVSFERGQILSASDKPSDAVMEQSLRLFAGAPGASLAGPLFDLAPPTHDRPFFYSILRVAELQRILERISLIPREEIGYLVNVAVLLQALILFVFVLFLPLIRWRKRLPRTGALLKAIVYFAGLGLGFLFLEILLIEKAAFFLNDATAAFAIVLAGMLIFSGLGSFLAGYRLERPRQAVVLAAVVVVLWVALAYLGLDPLLFALLGLPPVAKAIVVVIVVAPLSIALGMPFPLGLYLFRGERSHFLPWAWSLNGAFSVIATPLANLIAVSAGYRAVLLLAAALYLIVLVMYPVAKGQTKLA
ncbi:MAG: hypothetical protein HY423_07655 [Candidatus Lambdaproteobacteria bacterium]|nr:hypothetical protein [Candidatus Lambdaproteobacteria bacterium]